MEVSAGLLMYRLSSGTLEVFLVHPGGPFFSRKDEGVWSIPKGLLAPDEDNLMAARREFEEETGIAPPESGYTDLGEVRLKSGKRILAWAFPGDCDPGRIVSNTFELEWPPRSGRVRSYPEVDRACFFSPAVARKKLNPAQGSFVDRLEASLSTARD